MGKQNQKAAKLLYRKSNCILNTRSKTCSGASQFMTKSAILQMKKKLPKTNYYIDNGKLKRDLSIATDKCILRGYYKRKLGRFKYSMKDSALDIIDKFKCDNSACGDSIPEEHEDKTSFNIDVTTLVIENLKDLLNDWIKKYLLDSNETKQKIETVLDSILHKLQSQRKSSSCTYTLDIRIEDQEHNQNSHKGRRADGKHSCLTVPITGKHLKLISTLSIPRNMKKHVNNDETPQSTRHTVHKSRYKSVYLTVSRSNTFLLNSSSFNLLSISTKSFTKRCATYDAKDVKCIKKHKVVLVPKSSEIIPDVTYQEQKEIKTDYVETKARPRVLEFEPMPSLVKSIYADDPANVTSTEKELYKSKNDHYTMTEKQSSFKIMTSSKHHTLKWEKATIVNKSNNTVSNNLERNIGNETIKRKFKNMNLCTVPKIMKTKKKTHKFPKRRNSKRNYFTRLYKKSCQQDNTVMKELNYILNHFSQYTGNKNIKLDITINVIPTDDAAIVSDFLSKNTTLTCCNELINTNSHQKQNISCKSSESQPKLISLLDGAVSQSKYVINKEISSEVTSTINKMDVNITNAEKTLPSSEIANDLSELRAMIKDLAVTIENLVHDHLKKLVPQNRSKKSNSLNKIKSKRTLRTSTLSKAIQFSNNKTKFQIVSGIKLSKEPKKKDMTEFNARLAKKSISYNIIESESILKVTDMTCAVPEISKEQFFDKELNGPVPKSKSDLEVGVSNKQMFAFHCKDVVKSGQFIPHNKFRDTAACSSGPCKYACPHIEKEACDSYNHHKEEYKCCNEPGCDGVQQNTRANGEDCEICSHNYSCSSVYIDVEEDRHNKITVRSRSGMGFWEGLIYCILLWIPVAVILWLIYVYVIKDKIQPRNPAIGRIMLPSLNRRNNSYFRITLSDLGF